MKNADKLMKTGWRTRVSLQLLSGGTLVEAVPVENTIVRSVRD